MPAFFGRSITGDSFHRVSFDLEMFLTRHKSKSKIRKNIDVQNS